MEGAKPILQAMTKRRIQIEQYQANVKYLEELRARYSARHMKLQDEYREGESVVRWKHTAILICRNQPMTDTKLSELNLKHDSKSSRLCTAGWMTNCANDTTHGSTSMCVLSFCRVP